MSNAHRTELETLAAEIREYDRNRQPGETEPREVTEKRNRATELTWEIGE